MIVDYFLKYICSLYYVSVLGVAYSGHHIDYQNWVILFYTCHMLDIYSELIFGVLT